MGAQLRLVACVLGIYATFLTWSLVYEPLTTREWPNSQAKFQAPCIVALVQAAVAAITGYLYLQRESTNYTTGEFLRTNWRDLLAISFTQSVSSPLATHSLQYVDFLTYMLAKSCKLIPILAVHLMLYHTKISNDKKVVAVAVTFGVVLFNLGSRKPVSKSSHHETSFITGFLPLALSLLLDGFTNATQDTLLKRNKASKDQKPITGGHLMLGLNLCIVIWNLLYLAVLDPNQALKTKTMITQDPLIAYYLLTYAVCGALGQICIFYTLQEYGSLVLVMVTVTRKMFSMILSILVYGHHVSKLQWLGICIVFGGITSEAVLKRQAASKTKSE
ncbi:LANO_0E02806g1_1 [Lachancea nothofagi CBS 11611]|uniref:UDP-galactose transporter homolog 1 n=1 Tax=Lachancea nothofagi CBS 11611 TaxID=1266666 RepID=A0A1G4JQD5_9SACH|nr:LANO_0E02806g1_1 [Lachancea nothofagi CBS 11611]